MMALREHVGHTWQHLKAPSVSTIDSVTPETYFDLRHLQAVGFPSIDELHFLQLVDVSILENYDSSNTSSAGREVEQHSNGHSVVQVPW